MALDEFLGDPPGVDPVVAAGEGLPYRRHPVVVDIRRGVGDSFQAGPLGDRVQGMVWVLFDTRLSNGSRVDTNTVRRATGRPPVTQGFLATPGEET